MSNSLWPHGLYSLSNSRGQNTGVGSSRGSSQPRDQTWVLCIGGRFFTVWVTTEVLEYTEELYKKGLNDQDKYDGVVTHLEPGILEQEVRLALGYTTMDKASGSDGIPAELFQILKDDAVKVLHSICQQIWKTQQWPQDWKTSVFIPIAKKGNAKESSNYYTIALISQASKVMHKILPASLQ